MPSPRPRVRNISAKQPPQFATRRQPTKPELKNVRTASNGATVGNRPCGPAHSVLAHGCSGINSLQICATAFNAFSPPNPIASWPANRPAASGSTRKREKKAGTSSVFYLPRTYFPLLPSGEGRGGEE